MSAFDKFALNSIHFILYVQNKLQKFSLMFLVVLVISVSGLFDYSDGTYSNNFASPASVVEINDSTSNDPVLFDFDGFGYSVASIGDLDGDGITDVIVGAFADDTAGLESGAIHVIFLNVNGTVKNVTEINGTTPNGPTLSREDYFGTSVAGVGDLDGDGIVDIIVGAPGDDAVSNNSGTIYVIFLNNNGTAKSTVEINGTTPNGPVLSAGDRFGTSVASIEDLNGDGVTDVMVGAYLDEDDGTSKGAVHIIFLDEPVVVRLVEFQKIYYNFSVDFKRKMYHMKASLSQLRIYSDQTEHVINTFFPSALNEKTWDEELAREICENLDFDSKYLLLFYYDRIGYDSDSKEIWSIIRDSEHVFLDFIEKLDSKNLLNISEQYRKNKDIIMFRRLALELPNFDFNNFNESIKSQFKKIDDRKEKIIYVLEEINSKFTTNDFREKFSSFVPSSDDLLSIAQHIEEELGIDSDLIMLFYGTKYDQEISEKYYNKIISEKVNILSAFMIQHGLIKIEKSDTKNNAVNLSSILIHEPKFDLVKVQGMYQRYSHLLEIFSKMMQFLVDEKIIDKTYLKFEELVKIVKNSGENRFDNILTISDFLVCSNEKYPKNSLISISKACCCLFLYSRGDISAQTACKSVQTDSQASEILYCNMDVNDDKLLVTEKHAIGNIIPKVLSNNNLDLKYISDFKRGLAIGYLYGSKKEMLMNKMDNVKSDIKKISEIKEELDEMHDSLKTVLDTEFESDTSYLEYAIKSQIVQAYMITTKGRGPALGEILDDDNLLKIASREIDSSMNLEEFLIKGTPKKKDPTIGSHTRIGVVPLNMNFDEFSEKFILIYAKAVKNYISKHSDRRKSDFSVNLFRIMTSPATFTPIRLGIQTADTDSDDPLYIIQSLLSKHFSTTDKLSLVSTFTNKSGSVGVRGIVEKTCDRNSLYSFIHKDLRNTMPNFIEIEQGMDKKFEQKLYQKYNVEQFSKFAMSVHSTLKITNDKNPLIHTLAKNIAEIVQDQNYSISTNDVEKIAPILFGKLDKFGRILSS
jgi:hypothetical protein